MTGDPRGSERAGHRAERGRKPLRLLMLGPRSGMVGGTMVLFEQLVRELEAEADVLVEAIDTSRGRPTFLNNALAAPRTLAALAKGVRRADVVVVHASARGVLHMAPVVGIISRLAGVPWIVRAFGGNLDEVFERQPRWVKAMVRRTTFRADLALLETRSLVDGIGRRFRRVAWMPNSRPLNTRLQDPAPHTGSPPTAESAAGAATHGAQRFVFMGIVKPSKGIPELIEAGERVHDLTNGAVTVDVFGPRHRLLAPSAFRKTQGVRYKGELDHDRVRATLGEYDALVLPTRYQGEGYPGAILEAYMAGLPVIASRWRSIPEIVDEASGILTEPGDVEDLVRAMMALTDAEKLSELRAGAAEKRSLFASERWTRAFIEWCRDVADERANALHVERTPS